MASAVHSYWDFPYMSVLNDPGFSLRCGISLVVAISLYTIFGVMVSFLFERKLRIQAGRPGYYYLAFEIFASIVTIVSVNLLFLDLFFIIFAAMR